MSNAGRKIDNLSLLGLQMITRREAVRLLGVGTAAAWFAKVQTHLAFLTSPQGAAAAKDCQTPPLAPGAPTSRERMALIETFKKRSEGLQNKYEARVYKSGLTMPYRLFRPAASGKLPLVMYLHGSGGLGDDNQKQLGLVNTFGTRVWLLPENQKKFSCYVVVPQTDKGWVHYDLSQEAQGIVGLLPGLGDGARLALEIVALPCRQFPIDESRIYVTANRWEAPALGT
jgi:predicted peptidase